MIIVDNDSKNAFPVPINSTIPPEIQDVAAHIDDDVNVAPVDHFDSSDSCHFIYKKCYSNSVLEYENICV